MLPRALFSICFLLISGSTLQAGALVSLVPAGPANGVNYAPGEQVRVDFFVQLDANSPATIRTRLLQFDLSDSNSALDFLPNLNHPTAEGGPISFWNLTAAPACAGDESFCGHNYFIDGEFPPRVGQPDRGLTLVYTGLTSSGDYQVILRQASPTIVGSLKVVMPQSGGNFVLDVLNADEGNLDMGAELRYGFGSVADPDRVTLRASDGQIIMVPGVGTDEFGRVAFAVVPEPAGFLLLVLGGAVTLARRPRRDLGES